MKCTKQQALDSINAKREYLGSLSDQIWDNPETLFEEFIRSGELSAKKYFMHAGFPLAFMTITAFILAFFKTEPVYTYMFLPFKLFAICGVYKPLAALLSGVLLSFPMLAVYLLRPKTEELEDE